MIQNTRKWQRIEFMPATPIGDQGERLTASPEHIRISREAAAQGMVLLKNEGSLFPLSGRVAVFGKAQIDYVKGGGGSGDVLSPYVRSIAEGLQIKEQEGKISLFGPLTDFYAADVAAQREKGVKPGYTVEPALPEALVQDAAAFTDTALITICRFSSEGWDRTGEPHDGDFYLSREEEAMVNQVKAAFSRVGVVLNTGGMMDVTWFRDSERIQAALLAWQAGMEGGLATADILVGDVNPSAHLNDTFAVNFAAYPSAEHFNDSEDYVDYTEDIYVGYRYFETLPGAAEKVCYPFGYGLSYTSFEIGDTSASADADGIRLTATVRNTGSRPGRQVVQAYASAPQGRLGKPARVLIAFKKTGELAPGESETVTLYAPMKNLASYDDLGKVQASAWVLEAGDYSFYIGDNVRDAAKLAYVYTVAEDTVLEQLTPKCLPHRLRERLLADGSLEPLATDDDLPKPPILTEILPFGGEQPKDQTWPITWSAWGQHPDKPVLMDVADGKLSLEAFVAHLSTEQKVHLLGGQPNRGCANTWGFGNIPRYGIPNAMTADGPAGVRINPECGVQTTAFPCETVLACSWDEELCSQVGQAAAEELRENNFAVWLAPAMNIHRNPLCGRNFEYISEDPLLTGKIAAALVRGIQSVGVSACIKHFACNNKETNRLDSDSRLSERALREIYLRGFEIAVREADPWCLMSSYNIINGVRASENRQLLTDILRGEWGYRGLVTTDWYTHGLHDREIAAGNDIKMGCGMPDYVLEKLREGSLSMKDVDTSVRRLLEWFLKLD